MIFDASSTKPNALSERRRTREICNQTVEEDEEEEESSSSSWSRLWRNGAVICISNSNQGAQKNTAKSNLFSQPFFSWRNFAEKKTFTHTHSLSLSKIKGFFGGFNRQKQTGI
jgi:hypothetical protein